MVLAWPSFLQRQIGTVRPGKQSPQYQLYHIGNCHVVCANRRHIHKTVITKNLCTKEIHVVIHIQLLVLREIHVCDSPAMFKWQLAKNAGISLEFKEMKEIDNTREMFIAITCG